MSRIFVTGDTHQSIDISKLNSTNFPVNTVLNKEDVMIITGDCGFVWSNSNEEKYWQKWLEEKNFTTLGCLGNHENYDLIENFPIVEKWGGKVRQINSSLFYAISGEIYIIDGKTFLFINGAESTDKEFRKPHESWWEQEAITEKDILNAELNLKRFNYEVDYIISHAGGEEVVSFLGFNVTKSDNLLSSLLKKTDFKKHYCGHYHYEKLIDNHQILYDSIDEIYSCGRSNRKGKIK